MQNFIILWDDNAERLHKMEASLQKALQKIKIQARIQINAEPPLLSRNHLIGKTPVIQINNGDYWYIMYGEIITEQQFFVLLNKLKREGIVF